MTPDEFDQKRRELIAMRTKYATRHDWVALMFGFFKRTDCDRFGHWWGRPFVHGYGQHEGLHFQKITTNRVRRCERCKAQDSFEISTELEFEE